MPLRAVAIVLVVASHAGLQTLWGGARRSRSPRRSWRWGWRFDSTDLARAASRGSPCSRFWFFAVGWAASKASTAWQRAAVTVVLAAGLVGYFGNPHRELLVFIGLALLIWLPTIHCHSAMTVVAGVIAEASLVTYFVHYQVYPLFGEHRLGGVVASILTGILLTMSLTQARNGIRGRETRPVSEGTATPARR